MKNDEVVLHSLFPYQIKDRERFYFRDHPKNLNFKSESYRKYWNTQIKRTVEGKWIDDKGTWVYMMPKLYFYINYARIVHSDRQQKPPNLRDNEWIIFTYLMCCEGFSGFELDEKYTCHQLVDAFEKGEVLDEVQLDSIPESAKTETGYKKYIEPWYYLTNHYLIDEPASNPLGAALYGNQMGNACILSSRGVGKSFTMFIGDFCHEWLTSGIKSMDDKSHINDRLLFGMGSADAPQLNRSLKNVKAFYEDMPGQFKYRDSKGKERTFMGPMYKRVQGKWETGDEIEHIVKRADNTSDIEGSYAQMVALTADRLTIGAGDRFRRLYVEEFGFVRNAIEVHAANVDSLQSMGSKVGMAVYLGTGGSIKKIREPKAIFESPASYGIFGIPNYWRNINKNIGLFIPKEYALDAYKDAHGNTKLEAARAKVLKDRKALRDESDSVSYSMEVMFNPIVPEEMLRPSATGLLPKQEAAEQLSNIEAYDLFKKYANVGKLVFDPTNEKGVRFEKDLAKKLKPILEWGKDDSKEDKTGALIVYEHPPDRIPDGLYWVVYDPAKQSGLDGSFHSVLVYKHFYVGTEKTKYDTIVAEWIGRKERLYDNYELVINIARYFNAKIFPEINVAGFVDWCSKNNHYNMLEADAFILEKEVNPNAKRSWYKVGFRMTNDRIKNWTTTMLRDWLTEVKEVDAMTGVPILRTMDWIMSPRILNEIIAFTDDPSDNFDHISSLRGLMLLLGKLDGKEPVDVDPKDPMEEKYGAYLRMVQQQQEQKKERCNFLRY